MTIHELALVTLYQEIETYKELLGKLRLEKERCDAAIAGGAEAMENMVWNLRQEGKLSSGESGVANAQLLRVDFQIEQQVTQAEIQYQIALQRLGPSHPSVQGSESSSCDATEIP